MEELFDKIKDGASKTKDVAGKLAKEVAKRTSNAITSTKLSYSINEANNKIKDIYEQIGKTIYEKYLDDDYTDSEFDVEFEQINALMQDIEVLQTKKAELKNILRCENCDTLNPTSAKYCSKCGAVLTVCDDIEADDDDDEEDVITITPEKGE